MLTASKAIVYVSLVSLAMDTNANPLVIYAVRLHARTRANASQVKMGKSSFANASQDSLDLDANFSTLVRAALVNTTECVLIIPTADRKESF